MMRRRGVLLVVAVGAVAVFALAASGHLGQHGQHGQPSTRSAAAVVRAPSRRPMVTNGRANPFATPVAKVMLPAGGRQGLSLHFDPLAVAPWAAAILLAILLVVLTIRRLGKPSSMYDPNAIGAASGDRGWSPLMTHLTRATALLGAVGIFASVLVYKSLFWQSLFVDPWFACYSLVVVAFIFSRFVFSIFYRPSRNYGLEPSVAVIVPAFNEEDAIGESLRSLLAVDYAPWLYDIIVVNDGSTDGTGREIDRIAAEDDRIRPIHFADNRGKRAAMAAGVRASDADVLVFIDSDSMVERNAIKIIVQPFADPRVGAVCGHADVANLDQGWLAKMQAVRYYIAFRVLKGAESLFGAVTCCSGCFAAYRRTAILPDLERWERQTFLGRPATLGDDRSLTNVVLRNWRVLYESRAVARTIVPATLNKFLHQQIRWKRSWTREGFILATFAWRKHPVAALSIYTNIAIAFVSPATTLRAIIIHPLFTGVRPLVFLLGLYAVSVMYGLWFQVLVPRRDALWAYALHFVFFYVGVLIWQNYYALATLRRSHWGTRPTSHHGSDPVPSFDSWSEIALRRIEAL